MISRVKEKDGKYIVDVGIGSGVGHAATYVTEHVSGAGVYREFKEYEAGKPQIALLKAPLKAGDSWEYTVKTGGVKVMDKWVRTVAGEETVKVPAGVFVAMRIDWVWYVEEKKAGSGTDWYAVDVGLVKRVNDQEAPYSCRLKRRRGSR